MLRGENRGSEKAGSHWESNPGHLWLEPRQPDDHQPSQSSICSAQVALNATVAHLTATQYVPSELH